MSEFPEVQGCHNDPAGIHYVQVMDSVFVQGTEHYCCL